MALPAVNRGKAGVRKQKVEMLEMLKIIEMQKIIECPKNAKKMQRKLNPG